ncbi:MAG: MBL fold metallo-hydrolase [Zoogloeaceae bacterium]|jgi:hydroxyacylglutathione hydrolase|nr:MBL fold metallo-hydrolase [Zoogloeaceae bacterium]
MSTPLKIFPGGIHALDSGYVRPGLDAIHFIVEQGRIAVIDTAHAASLPRFLDALEGLGLNAQAVDYVILTHVHLDHAGGAGAYMAALPNARLIVHPRGARHMIDPTALFAGASAVYGEEEVKRLYGPPTPVAAERVIEAADGQIFELAGRPLQTLHTPGHAKHHLSLWDERARAAFTGDTFGLSYREMDQNGHPFILPTTTPVQFDPEAMKASLARLLALKPEALYLTHFSRVGEVERLGADMERRIDAFVQIAEAAQADGGDSEQKKNAIRAALANYIRAEAPWVDEETQENLLSVDHELNAQGLTWWIEHRS